MDTEVKLRASFPPDMLPLIWGMRKLDTGWHTFNVIFSDDQGKTLLPVELSRRSLQTQLLSITLSSVLEMLGAMRSGSFEDEMD